MLNENTIQEDIQEVLTTVLKMIDKEGVDDSGSFETIIREIARVTIESLIKDGRIHPTRIEELYDKSLKEITTQIREYGEAALFELGLTKVDAELVELLGKLHFRTSYGQNAVQHSL